MWSAAFSWFSCWVQQYFSCLISAKTYLKFSYCKPTTAKASCRYYHSGFFFLYTSRSSYNFSSGSKLFSLLRNRMACCTVKFASANSKHFPPANLGPPSLCHSSSIQLVGKEENANFCFSNLFTQIHNGCYASTLVVLCCIVSFHEYSKFMLAQIILFICSILKAKGHKGHLHRSKIYTVQLECRQHMHKWYTTKVFKNH